MLAAIPCLVFISNTPYSWREADLRTKIIAFEVRDGRLEKLGTDSNMPQSQKGLLHARTDALVRKCEGRNLLIVEIKAPDDPLDDEARDQSISYASLLVRGNKALLSF